MSENISSRILYYLKRYYLDSSENAAADYHCLINGFGRSIPFTGRTSLFGKAKNVFDARIKDKNVYDRNSRPIGIIGGVSGLGKSRALIELADKVSDWKTEKEWIFKVIISYDSRNPPVYDRVLGASKALALRLLYFAFVFSKPRAVSFATFARDFNDVFKESVDPQHAIEVIVLYQSDVCECKAGVIFFGLDEAQRLIYHDYADEGEKLSFLKETMVAVGSTMRHLILCYRRNCRLTIKCSICWFKSTHCTISNKRIGC